MSSDDVYTLHRGTTPLLLSLPHVGTEIPPELQPAYVPRALICEDADRHLARLYGFARELGASVLVPRYGRYLIDLNRPPDDTPMYAGANNTELCPSRFFTGEPLYREGQAPNAAEIVQRRERYWQPYHAALSAELASLKEAHGHALLWDGHSIKSELPWLFEGKLPDLNLGTAEGRSCAAELRTALSSVLASQSEYTQVIDGRFKGGYIPRHYGRPQDGIHAVQLEMCWSCYMQETPPYDYVEEKAVRVQPLLRRLLETMLAWRPQ